MYDDERQDQATADEARKPYASPRLAVHGTVEALTHAPKLPVTVQGADDDEPGTDVDELK